MKDKGLVHIYCGDGKGKTTAAVGMAIRCAGWGGKVLFFQFMKANTSGERAVLANTDNITLVDGPDNMSFFWNMTEEEKKKTAQYYNLKLEELKDMAYNGNYDMFVMDEITSAISCGMVDPNKVYSLIDNKPEGLEIVMTGRDPADKLTEKADYISEIKNIRHPFDKNVSARKMIEY